MREYEAYAGLRGEAEFRYDGQEIGTVGAQAVQPDDGKFRESRSFDFQGWQMGFQNYILVRGSACQYAEDHPDWPQISTPGPGHRFVLTTGKKPFPLWHRPSEYLPAMNVKNLTQSTWLPILLLLSLGMGGCSNLPGWMLWQRKAAVTDFQHFDNAPVLRAEQASELPPAGKENPLRLPAMADGEIFPKMLERTGTTAFIVIRHGQIVMEQYFNGGAHDTVMPSFSVAKSIVATLLGIALSEGSIGSIDDAVTLYLPELAKRDARFSQVRLRQLLEMRSGIDFEEEYKTPWDDAAVFYLTEDIAAEVRDLGIERNPDEAFHYSSGDTQILGLVIQRATGMPLPLYLQQKIWQPMGAAYDASWSLDSREHGNAKAFCCLNASAVDYARFGQLILHEGKLGERQIVPAEWIRNSVAVRQHPGSNTASRWNIENPGTRKAAFYTWHWRRFPLPDVSADSGMKPSPDIYAQGLLGQYVYIAPEADMVIIRLGKRNGKTRWPSLFHDIAELNAGRKAAAENLTFGDKTGR